MDIIIHPAFASQSIARFACELDICVGHAARPLVALAVNNTRARLAAGAPTSVAQEWAALRSMTEEVRSCEVLAMGSYSRGWSWLDVIGPENTRMFLLVRGTLDKYRGARRVSAQVIKTRPVQGRRDVWVSPFRTVITR